MTDTSLATRHEGATDFDFAPEPGRFYDNLPGEIYHSCDGVSSSRLKRILDWSPLHFRHAPPVKETDAMRRGTVLHAMALEPETVDDLYLFAPGLKLNTKAGKEAYAELAEQAEAEGKTLLREDPDKLWKVARAIQAHHAWNLIVGEKPSFERSFFWEDSGQLLKCRPDSLNLDYANGSALIVDLKSASDPRDRKFSRQVVDLGYDFSAAMYCAGVEAVLGVACQWAWFVFEPEPPYSTRVVFAGEKWLERGRVLYRQAVDTLAECQASDTWPGLDAGKAVVLDMPKWAELEEVSRG